MKKIAQALLFSLSLLILFSTFSSTVTATTSWLSINLVDPSQDALPPITNVNVVVWNATLGNLVGGITYSSGDFGNVTLYNLDTAYSYNVGANKDTDSPYDPAYNSLQGVYEATGLVPGTFTHQTFSNLTAGKIPIQMDIFSENLNPPTPTPTASPIPCPYSSLEVQVRVSLDGGDFWEDWRLNTSVSLPLKLSQYQSDDLQTKVIATNKDGSTTTPNGNYVSLQFVGDAIDPANPALDPSSPPINIGYVSPVSYPKSHVLRASGVGICSGKISSAEAYISFVYCPYRSVGIFSNRGRPGSPWEELLRTPNKKDVKNGIVQTKVTYSLANRTAEVDDPLASGENLTVLLKKPPAAGEGYWRTIYNGSDDFLYNYPAPLSWYADGLFLNYPGTYNLRAVAKNDSVANCGDYPPEASGEITIINCSFDSTIAGFQMVADPVQPWRRTSSALSGGTARAGGFHDHDLASINPRLQDVSLITPRDQVALKVTDSAATFNQNLDQGAGYTYRLPAAVLSNTYTLAVSTPDYDYPRPPGTPPTEYENGIGCYDSATLTVGAAAVAPAVCEIPENPIDCCPLVTGNGLLSDLYTALLNFALGIGGDILENIIRFRFTASIEKVRFTTDRIAEANWLYGRVVKDPETGADKFEPGSLFKLSPDPEGLGLGTETEKIEGRNDQVSWNLGLKNVPNFTVKSGSDKHFAPIEKAGCQLQNFLTVTENDSTGDGCLPSPTPTPTPATGAFLNLKSNDKLVKAETTLPANPPGKTDEVVIAESLPGTSFLQGSVLGDADLDGPSCREPLPARKNEVSCYESGTSALTNSQTLQFFLNVLRNSKDFLLKIDDLDKIARSIVGVPTDDAPYGDAYRSDAKGKNKFRDNPGFLQIFLTQNEEQYENKPAEGKTSPIRFNFEMGLSTFNLLGNNLFLTFFKMPQSGTGSVPAEQFSPLLHDCSVVYSEPLGVSPINSYLPKLACTYIVYDPKLKIRYFGSLALARANTDPSFGPVGALVKLDPLGEGPSGTIVIEPEETPTPTPTLPPGVTPTPAPVSGMCNVCNFSLGNFGLPDSHLKTLIEEVSNRTGVPGSVLTGVLKFEGYEPANPQKHIFYDSNNLIDEISAAGGVSPYCVTSYAGARGPYQFMPYQWGLYGNSVKAYYPTREPNICNLRDAMYAAAAKLKNDAGRLLSACGYTNTAAPPATSCNWSDANIAVAIKLYYGACKDYYYSTVINYFHEYTCPGT